MVAITFAQADNLRRLRQETGLDARTFVKVIEREPVGRHTKKLVEMAADRLGITLPAGFIMVDEDGGER